MESILSNQAHWIYYGFTITLILWLKLFAKISNKLDQQPSNILTPSPIAYKSMACVTIWLKTNRDYFLTQFTDHLNAINTFHDNYFQHNNRTSVSHWCHQ
jgi:hypothetical protein